MIQVFVNRKALPGWAIALVVAGSLSLKADYQDGAPLECVAIIESKGVAGSLDHLFVDATASRLFLANQANNTLDVMDLKPTSWCLPEGTVVQPVPLPK